MTDSCKTIWILNHYATAMFVSEGGRHYSLAKEFVRQGYSVKVFCASTIHNSDECIPMEGERHKKAVKDGVEFEFIRTRPYGGNGIQSSNGRAVHRQNLISGLGSGLGGGAVLGNFLNGTGGAENDAQVGGVSVRDRALLRAKGSQLGPSGRTGSGAVTDYQGSHGAVSYTHLTLPTIA